MRLAKTTVMFITLLISVITNAAEPASQAQEVRAVDFAIKYYMKATPGQPLMRNPVLRENLAQEITTAARTQEVVIPVALLTTIVYDESTFDVTAKGKLGEIGLTQVHGEAAKNCDLKDAKGQLDCGARWLALKFQECGTWKGALTAYASGKGCISKSDRTKTLVDYRLRQWAKLEKEIQSHLNTEFGG